MSVRTEKVAEELKHKLNTAMSKDLMELNLGLVTISKVIVSPDLRVAKVYLTFLGNQLPIDKCLSKLELRKKHIRHMLGKSISLRYVPELFFYHDDTFEYADHIEKLFKQINKDDQSSEGGL